MIAAHADNANPTRPVILDSVVFEPERWDRRGSQPSLVEAFSAYTY
jgi:hypothetical protein